MGSLLSVDATRRAAEWLLAHRFHTTIGPAEQRHVTGTYTWKCACVSCLTQVAPDADDEDGAHIRRASGEVTCQHCGLLYRQHPVSWHRSWDGQPYLHRLCDGGLVHL